MNKILFTILCTLLSGILSPTRAQIAQVKIAYVNTTEILNSFSAKEEATQKLLTLSEN